MHTRVRRFHHPTAGWFCDVPDTVDTQRLGEGTTACVRRENEGEEEEEEDDHESSSSSSSLSMRLRGRVLDVCDKDSFLLLSCGGLLASVPSSSSSSSTVAKPWRVHDAVTLHLETPFSSPSPS